MAANSQTSHRLMGRYTMDKLLEPAAWRHFALFVVPGALIMCTLVITLGLDASATIQATNASVLAFGFAIAVVTTSVFLEEVAGTYEAWAIDHHLYPRYRRLARGWGYRSAKRRDVHRASFQLIWQRYLNRARPDQREVRWAYYSSLVQRYRVTQMFGFAMLSSAAIWLSAEHLGWVSRYGLASLLHNGAGTWISVGSLGLGAYALLWEAPSSCLLLHYHRTHLCRRRAVSDQCVPTSHKA